MTPELAHHLTEEAMLEWHRAIMNCSSSTSLDYHAKLNEKFLAVSRYTNQLKINFSLNLNWFLRALAEFTTFIPFSGSSEQVSLLKMVRLSKSVEEPTTVTLDKIVTIVRDMLVPFVRHATADSPIISVSSMCEVLVKLFEVLKSPTSSAVDSFLYYLIKWSVVLINRRELYSRLKTLTGA